MGVGGARLLLPLVAAMVAVCMLLVLAAGCDPCRATEGPLKAVVVDKGQQQQQQQQRQRGPRVQARVTEMTRGHKTDKARHMRDGELGIVMAAHRRVAVPYDYEDPIEYGCHASEADVRVDGVSGSFCAPTCSRTQPCSTNLPPDTTAHPECVLETQGDPYPTLCALICHMSGSECPPNASCKPVGGFGICTYDE